MAGRRVAWPGIRTRDYVAQSGLRQGELGGACDFLPLAIRLEPRAIGSRDPAPMGGQGTPALNPRGYGTSDAGQN